MNRFIKLYTLNILILFGIFYIDMSPIADIVNSFQIDLISKILSLFLDNIYQDRIEITSHYNLIIERDCNGLMVYFLFLSTILATNISLLSKFLWALIGYFVISIINIFRIYIITLLVLDDESNFYLAHNILGNIMAIFKLAVFSIFNFY